jgi:hypothetical protein
MQEAEEEYVRAAYRLDRDYDGEGSAFGDQALSARTNKKRRSAVDAATGSEDEDQLNIIVINRTAAEQETVIEVEHATEFSTARLSTLTDRGPEIEEQSSVGVAEDNQIEYVDAAPLGLAVRTGPVGFTGSGLVRCCRGTGNPHRTLQRFGQWWRGSPSVAERPARAVSSLVSGRGRPRDSTPVAGQQCTCGDAGSTAGTGACPALAGV